MKGVYKTEYQGRAILVIDYSSCKEGEMIERLTYAAALIESENTPTRVLSILDDKTYITPRFLREVETVNLKTHTLLERQSVVGLTSVQKVILKGFNLFTPSTVLRSFDTQDEAFQYLVG